MWQTYLRPTTLSEALDLLDHYAGQARIIAGGTDVLVELSRGVRPTATLIDITAIPGLKYVRDDGDGIALGALATHNDVIASRGCVERALPLAQACLEIGAPQIRTRATVAGNLVTASPANDTITPLVALGADVVLASKAGERIVPLADFYQGVRKTLLQPQELLREIRIPSLRSDRRWHFVKLGLRRAQAISVINVAFALTFANDVVEDARITLGSVAPTIVRARSAEAYLRDKRLDTQVCTEAGRLASADATPVDDVRGSATYRRATVATLVADGLLQLAEGIPVTEGLIHPVLLDTGAAKRQLATPERQAPPFDGSIETIINGRPYTLAQAAGKTLLNALREDAALTGTKEGCAEGECGACTVWLNGQAVMSCLVPAAQAHGAQLTTIEGLAQTGAPSDNELHPLQRAFVEAGAVQCGYCIPGMLMAGAKLLGERPQPSLEAVQTALSGNICRCTGYRKILDAVLAAGSPRHA
ncbi:MAG TPA: FAD binding domain-containing protein [Ktedonobacterales bacterium]|nr:FAD binding domain-containing protein [Ktedonobacterales bacterium]